jgi:hypothetical protein
VRYTLPCSLTLPLTTDRMLMMTPRERVLAAILLDTKLNVRFVRTGSAAEGAHVALVNAGALLEVGGRHWDVALEWDPDGLAIEVRDQHDDSRPLRGRWPPAR